MPATALAAGRVAFGAGLTVAPGPFAGVWIGGRRARDPLTRVICRGFGMRDLALGAGALLALRRTDFGRPRWWFTAQALADATDMVATIAAWPVLPPRRRVLVAGLAAGSAALGVAVAVAGVGERPEIAVGSGVAGNRLQSNQEM